MEIEKPLFSKVSFSLPFLDGKGNEFYFGINIFEDRKIIYIYIFFSFCLRWKLLFSHFFNWFEVSIFNILKCIK